MCEPFGEDAFAHAQLPRDLPSWEVEEIDRDDRLPQFGGKPSAEVGKPSVRFNACQAGRSATLSEQQVRILARNSH